MCGEKAASPMYRMYLIRIRCKDRGENSYGGFRRVWLANGPPAQWSNPPRRPARRGRPGGWGRWRAPRRQNSPPPGKCRLACGGRCSTRFPSRVLTRNSGLLSGSRLISPSSPMMRNWSRGTCEFQRTSTTPCTPPGSCISTVAESSTPMRCTAFDSRPQARSTLPKRKFMASMRCEASVVERAAAGQRRVAQPFAAFDFEPAVAVGLGQQRPADGALLHEVLRAEEFRIKSAVIRNAEETP